MNQEEKIPVALDPETLWAWIGLNQSDTWVGNKPIMFTLYTANTSPNRWIPQKSILGVKISTLEPGMGLKAFPEFIIAFIGEYMPLITVRMEKKCRFEPAIYIMNDVMKTCFRGENARFWRAAVRLSNNSFVSSCSSCWDPVELPDFSLPCDTMYYMIGMTYYTIDIINTTHCYILMTLIPGWEWRTCALIRWNIDGIYLKERLRSRRRVSHDMNVIEIF